MRTALGCLAMLTLACGLAAGRPDDAKGTVTDEGFVHKVTACGLAEVNAGRIAAKQASSPAVKAFAQKMVDDHSKANKELLKIADKKGLKAARTQDEKHKEGADKLLKLSGIDFDREYMLCQVKDHEEAVALFEKQSKSGKDADLKAWAEKTLPTLKEHLKEARDISAKLKSK
jgi:putative membrane protein